MAGMLLETEVAACSSELLNQIVARVIGAFIIIAFVW
jgi:hypothetical protein